MAWIRFVHRTTKSMCCLAAESSGRPNMAPQKPVAQSVRTDFWLSLVQKWQSSQRLRTHTAHAVDFESLSRRLVIKTVSQQDELAQLGCQSSSSFYRSPSEFHGNATTVLPASSYWTAKISDCLTFEAIGRLEPAIHRGRTFISQHRLIPGRSIFLALSVRENGTSMRKFTTGEFSLLTMTS